MVPAEELAAAHTFFQDCHDPFGKRVEQELAPHVQEFLTKHTDRPIVVVTSGGTQVPLEKRCVRFIDNFSAGHRGALSTEQFLEAGYAVLHLHRDSSVEPFTDGLPGSSLLGLLKAGFEFEGQQGTPTADGTSLQPSRRVTVAQGAQPQIASCLTRARQADAQQTLLMVPFQNLFEYLQSLRCIAMAMNSLGHRALFYLAAAVSDFYAPWSELAEHKIQSSDGPLQLSLQKVPKMLSLLTAEWAPSSMVVSFKLETDPGMLVRKAAAALHKYRMDAVIANLLHTRKDQVLLVTRPEDDSSRVGAESWQQNEQAGPSQQSGEEACSEDSVHRITINRAQNEAHIERPLVRAVVEKHSQFMAQSLHCTAQ